jgi:hypothetical protein
VNASKELQQLADRLAVVGLGQIDFSIDERRDRLIGTIGIQGLGQDFGLLDGFVGVRPNPLKGVEAYGRFRVNLTFDSSQAFVGQVNRFDPILNQVIKELDQLSQGHVSPLIERLIVEADLIENLFQQIY